MRLTPALGLLVLIALGVVAVSARPVWPAQTQTALKVVTTVAPLANIALNVGGNRIALTQIVPDGTDSHTFEPTPSDSRKLAEADLIVVNGLHLEGTTISLAESNKKASTPILHLADNAITRDQWIFDFSFPENAGDPNPHLWMNPRHAARYAELIRDQLAEVDPAGAAFYEENTARFIARIDQLDQAISTSIATIPDKNRKLLTYHDSFAYFAPRYGMTVIGAIQPADFAEPSPREVAALIDQLKAEQVPAIFGSEVFPSRVLEQIAREAGVTFYDTLRDDDLPGSIDAPEHTYVGMLAEDVTTMARALGGDASSIAGIDPTNTFQQ